MSNHFLFVSLSVAPCRVVVVCLDHRVLLDSVVLLVCLDREEREVSLACPDLLYVHIVTLQTLQNCVVYQ